MNRLAPAPDPRFTELMRRYALTGGAADKLRALLAHLSTDEHAPTSAAGAKGALDVHIADSLVALELDVVRDAHTAADLGSGAGLPGLALAVTLSGLEMSLVESQQRKCSYLEGLIDALGLANTRVVCARAESWPGGLGAHDLVIARALAAQAVVLEYAAPLLSLGGRLVEWRGRRDAAEEERAARAAEELGLRAVEVRAVEPFSGAHSRHLHVFEKVAPTPARYPRRPGVAARRPLGA